VKNRLLTLTPAILAIVLIAFLACNKNADTSAANSNPNHIPADQMVTASLQGRVVDQSGIPVQGAAVTSGGASSTTDVNGIFSFSAISMSSRFGYVTATKQGFFTGSRSIITNAGASNYVTIQLVPRTASGSFPAPTGGKVVVGPGDTASFAASSVVEAATGAPYTGTVTVYANYLNPTDPNLYKYMPGDLRGIGSDGNETALQSFGMMDVEMQDDAGNRLQIASGQKAVLSFAIPDSLLSLAPATIALWYFNDTTGRWIEQGSATRQGNSYIGPVAHFSFWNCDAPLGTVNFKVRLKDQFGNPLAYTFIQFEIPGYGARGGYTDSTGFAQGLLPKGEHVIMQVLSDCGNFIGGANVGPALSDQDLGTVVVNIVHGELTLTGNVEDCNNNPVDSGYVNVLMDGLDYRAVVRNGKFNLPVNRCYSSNAPVQVLAMDMTTAESSTVTTITADTGIVNAGTLSACTVAPPPPQFLNFTLGANSYSLTAPADNISAETHGSPTARMTGYQTSLNIEMFLGDLIAPGNYSGGFDSCYLNVGNTSFYGPVSYTISAYGPIGAYLQGSFTGLLLNENDGTDQEQISGTFNLLRAN
jgi:hypothetical protein